MPPEANRRPAFLMGIDLEPLPLTDPGCAQSWDDLATLTHVVLDCLRRNGWRATFFTVGQVVEERPELLAEIIADGHEIACHTHTHDRLGRFTPDGFRRDLEMNLAVLYQAGVTAVSGFRAPFFSLTEASAAFAYQTLKSCGLTYSSSVSSSRNFGGWSGRAPSVAAAAGMVELPVTSLWTGVPLGGLYWRCCPEPVLSRRIRRLAADADYLTSFFHAHDFYSERATYLNRSSILRNPVIAAALAVGRKSVEDKLDAIRDLDFSVLAFQEYLEREDTRYRVRPAAAKERSR